MSTISTTAALLYNSMLAKTGDCYILAVHVTCCIPEALLLIIQQCRLLFHTPIWEQVSPYVRIVTPANVDTEEFIINGKPIVEPCLQQDFLEPAGFKQHMNGT